MLVCGAGVRAATVCAGGCAWLGRLRVHPTARGDAHSARRPVSAWGTAPASSRRLGCLCCCRSAGSRRACASWAARPAPVYPDCAPHRPFGPCACPAASAGVSGVPSVRIIPSTSSLVKISGGFPTLATSTRITRLPLMLTKSTSSAACRRSILEGHLPIHLADLVIRLALGKEHHIRAHAHQHMVVENRVLQLRRQRVGKGLDRRFHFKRDQGRQQRFDLLARQFRNMVLKGQRQARASWPLSVLIRILHHRIRRRVRHRSGRGAESDALHRVRHSDRKIILECSILTSVITSRSPGLADSPLAVTMDR